MKTNIDKGWAWVVMITSYMGMIILSIAIYMNGVIYVELLHKYNEGEAKTSLVGALCSGLHCCLAPLAGALNNKVSCRFSMVLGGVVTTIGYAACAFANSLNMIIIFNGVFAGVGFSLSMSGLICVVGFYFEKYRDIVLSIVFLTVGISMFVSAPFGLYLLDMYGLTSTYLIQASIQVHICIFGVLSRPSVTEIHIQKQKLKERNQNLKMRAISFLDITLLKNRSYFCILLSIITWNFCLSAGFIHLPNYISVLNGSNSEISLIMLSFSLSNLAGRLFGSFTVSRLRRHIVKVYATGLSISGLITALFVTYSKLSAGIYIFAIQLGIFTGWPNTMMMPISLDYVGISKLSEAYGYFFLFSGMGAFTGPFIIGYIYGVSESYENSFIVAGVILFLGGLSAICSFLLENRESTASEILSNEQTFIKDLHNCNNVDTNIGASIGSIRSGSVTDLMACTRSQTFCIKDTNRIVKYSKDLRECDDLLDVQR